MALSRKALKAMGITDEQVDSIIEMHMETVDGLKKERDGYKEKAEKYDEAEKQLEALAKDDFKAKYEKEHSDFESYKKSVTEKETRSAKEKAVRAYFEGKGITGSNLDIAMRGAKDEISAVELDGDKIKDAALLDELVKGDFKSLIVTQALKGANTATPPANGGAKMTKADILKIKDTAERQKAIADNHELFGF